MSPFHALFVAIFAVAAVMYAASSARQDEWRVGVSAFLLAIGFAAVAIFAASLR